MARKIIFMLTITVAITPIKVSPAYAVSEEFLFGASGIRPIFLSLNGGATMLSTGDSLFGRFKNQGWWSATAENEDDNDNFLVGQLVRDAVGILGGETGMYNNFFTFDISRLAASVENATLELRRHWGFSDSGALTHDYHLYDVTTAPDVLNMNVGASAAIFDDLGSGVSYGSHTISVAGDTSEILMLDLNANAIADLNTAIANRDSWFSVGGTLTPGIVSVPETGGTIVMMCSSLLGMVLLRVRGPRVKTTSSPMCHVR